MNQREPDTETVSLTAWEKKILGLVLQGKINKEIAAELSLSEQTVKNYLRGALRHFGARRTRELFPIIERVRSEIQHSTLPKSLE